jgi:transposase-like protein
MIKSKSAAKGKRYPAEFRHQIVELVRAGRKVSALAREFGCTVWSIHRWVHQAERDAGVGDGGLTTDERRELTQLRRENLELRMDREILSKAAAWFAQERGTNAKRSSDL